MTEITQDKSVQISPETLPVITWEGARVITTELLARLYGTEIGNVQKNFERNADRFESGKHFYKLEGECLRKFKQEVNRVDKSYSVANPRQLEKSLTDFKSVSRNARSLMLWTERGAARHAKMLETDAAWDVFEQLEDCYFSVRAERQYPYTVLPGQTLSSEQADDLRKMISSHAERLPKSRQAAFVIQAWSKLKAHFGVSYRGIPASEFPEAISLIGRHIAETLALEDAPTQYLLTCDAGRVSLTPITERDTLPDVARMADVIRDYRVPVSSSALAYIAQVCLERLRSKAGALEEARYVASQRGMN